MSKTDPTPEVSARDAVIKIWEHRCQDVSHGGYNLRGCWQCYEDLILSEYARGKKDGQEEAKGPWLAYVALLTDEINLLIGLAVTHGWQGDKVRNEVGKRLRQQCGITEDDVKAAIGALELEEWHGRQRKDA